MSRLRSRIDVVKNRRRRPESYTALKVLTTEDFRRALVLIERGGVLANGEVRNPEVYRHASREELEALERSTQLCGQTLDHLEAAEELLDRMGDAYGWRSPEATDAALLRERLELPGASPWLVEETAEAVVRFYAELEEHSDQSSHPALRSAVRRLERLKEIVYVSSSPDKEMLPKSHRRRLEDGESRSITDRVSAQSAEVLTAKGKPV
jgi:hypothetical protein